VVRSLYFRPHYVKSANEEETERVDAKEVEDHAHFTKGYAAYQSKLIYYPQSQSISYTTLSRFPPVKLLPQSGRKRVLVTGGAGIVGSHLVDRLMLLGHEVTVLDNFFTGSKTSVSHWVGHPNFELVRHDVFEPFMIECDRAFIWNQSPQNVPCPDLLTAVCQRFTTLPALLLPSLPIKCRKYDQNFIPGYPEHAWSCEAHKSAFFIDQHIR
jgi:hypothetical protein